MPEKIYTVLDATGLPFEVTREEIGYLVQRGIVLKLKKGPPRSIPEARQVVSRAISLLGAAFSVPRQSCAARDAPGRREDTPRASP